MSRLSATRTAACALCLAAVLGLSACGSDTEPGVDEPAREGLAVDLGGVDYNIFLTRELNLSIVEDRAYYAGPAARPGHALYGVFLQACNTGKELRRTVAPGEVTVTDNQGNEFRPIELPRVNAFAYQARVLAEDECIPAVGSVAQLGPTAGSMLLFDFPLTNTENRPLELEMEKFNVVEGKPEKISFDLDL